MIEFPSQIKAARVFLGWSQRELSQHAEISLETVRRLEQDRGFKGCSYQTIKKLLHALEEAGIRFINSDTSIGITLLRTHLPGQEQVYPPTPKASVD